MKKIKIKYHNDKLDKIKKIEKGDWLDLRCNGVIKIDTDFIITDRHLLGDKVLPLLMRKEVKTQLKFEDGDFRGKRVKFIRYKKGDYLLINLGVSMELPVGYEAYVNPRGSTYKTFGLTQTNSQGVIDYMFKGDNDIWFMPVLAQKDGFIMLNERVCQFRIQKKMPKIAFEEVEHLNSEDRGSHGSTGTN